MEIGPQIPSHILEKRKRKATEGEGEEEEEREGRKETESAKTNSNNASSNKAARVVGPTLPPLTTSASRPSNRNDDEIDISSDDEDHDIGPSLPTAASSEKPRRVMGPAPPPAPLDERPPGDPDHEDSSSDNEELEIHGPSSDDEELEIGPALPSATSSREEEELAAQARLAKYADSSSTDRKQKRDSWMLAPPDGSDWSSRVDPTKIRARKFQTGRGARAPHTNTGQSSALWTETPEQKLKRLGEEIMGIRKPATQGGDEKPKKSTFEEDTAKKIKEYNDKYRSTSLYNEHQKSATKKEEDDPSKRKWDREKDLAGGRKVSYAQKQEMMKKAANFGDRFTRGSFQ